MAAARSPPPERQAARQPRRDHLDQSVPDAERAERLPDRAPEPAATRPAGNARGAAPPSSSSCTSDSSSTATSPWPSPSMSPAATGRRSFAEARERGGVEDETAGALARDARDPGAVVRRDGGGECQRGSLRNGVRPAQKFRRTLRSSPAAVSSRSSRTTRRTSVAAPWAGAREPGSSSPERTKEGSPPPLRREASSAAAALARAGDAAETATAAGSSGRAREDPVREAETSTSSALLPTSRAAPPCQRPAWQWTRGATRSAATSARARAHRRSLPGSSMRKRSGLA